MRFCVILDGLECCFGVVWCVLGVLGCFHGPELVRNISQNVSEEISIFLQSTDFETFYCSMIGFIVHSFPDIESEALNHFLTLSSATLSGNTV